MRILGLLSLAALVVCVTAFADVALYTHATDAVTIPGPTYSGGTLECVGGSAGFNELLPTSGGTMSGIAAGPFTYTVMFEGTEHQDFAGGEVGTFRLIWFAGPSPPPSRKRV